MQRNIKSGFQQVVSLSPLLSDDLQTLAVNITEPGRLADFIASSLSTLSTAVKQEILETLDVPAYKIGSGEADNIPLIRHIARKGKPVILSTGYATAHNAVEAFHLGVTDVLFKPLELDALKLTMKRLRETLAQRRRIDQLTAQLSSHAAPPPSPSLGKRKRGAVAAATRLNALIPPMRRSEEGSFPVRLSLASRRHQAGSGSASVTG